MKRGRDEDNTLTWGIGEKPAANSIDEALGSVLPPTLEPAQPIPLTEKVEPVPLTKPKSIVEIKAVKKRDSSEPPKLLAAITDEEFERLSEQYQNQGFIFAGRKSENKTDYQHRLKSRKGRMYDLVSKENLSEQEKKILKYNEILKRGETQKPVETHADELRWLYSQQGCTVRELRKQSDAGKWQAVYLFYRPSLNEPSGKVVDLDMPVVN